MGWVTVFRSLRFGDRFRAWFIVANTLPLLQVNGTRSSNVLLEEITPKSKHRPVYTNWFPRLDQNQLSMKLFDLNKHRDRACNLVLPPPFRPVALVCSSPLPFLPSLVSPDIAFQFLSSLLYSLFLLSCQSSHQRLYPFRRSGILYILNSCRYN